MVLFRSIDSFARYNQISAMRMSFKALMATHTLLSVYHHLEFI